LEELEKTSSNLKSKEQECNILKAKITLDLIDMKILLVPEYPDLVDENNELIKEIEDLNHEIEALKEKEVEAKTDNYQLSMQCD
jgi:hypothetical protein